MVRKHIAPSSQHDQVAIGETMNRHEQLCRSTERALIALFGVWIAAMGLMLVVPARVWKANPNLGPVVIAVVFGGLLVAMAVLSMVRMVSYMRWTGKYPFYFLFRRTRGGDRGSK